MRSMSYKYVVPFILKNHFISFKSVFPMSNKHYQHFKHRNSRRTIPVYIWAPVALGSAVVVMGYYSCLDEAPLTKRKRMIATSPEWEAKLGDEQYEQLLRQYRGQILPPDHRASITVRRVGTRLATASELFRKKYIRSNQSKAMFARENKFTFTVLRNDAANAFVLPGNHVFVFTGLFKYAHNEDELAAVLAHEMGHTLARHAGERISGSIVVSLFARFTLLLDPSGFLYTIFLPTAALLHELPNSREAEVEADRIGIHLAAEACYDPRSAKNVFLAMKEGEGYAHPPQFLSTHPSNDTRISNFSDASFMGDAINNFNAENGSRCRQIRQEMRKARQVAAIKAASREKLSFK